MILLYIFYMQTTTYKHTVLSLPSADHIHQIQPGVGEVPEEWEVGNRDHAEFFVKSQYVDYLEASG